jgi:hypothetical protein
MVRSEGNMSLKNPVTPPGIDPGTVRLVAQHLNLYVIPGPDSHSIAINIWKIASSTGESEMVLELHEEL